jgi:ABC-type sugar transport system ATPase subunit
MPNPRIKLVLPIELAEWIDKELIFLGVGNRVVLVEETGIMQKSDFLRIVINNWILRTLEVGPKLEPLETEESDRGNAYVPFYLDDRMSRGLWNSGVRAGLAAPYVEADSRAYSILANRAFTEYWDRQVSLAQGVQRQLVALQDAIVQHPRKSLSQVIREVVSVG